VAEGGEDFMAVAGEVSSADAGGLELGWFPRGQMVKEFEEAVFGLGEGGMTDIIETAFGLHVAQNIGRRAPSTLTFEQARDQIADKIMQHKCGAVIVTHVEQLKARAVIE
jgi:parvulin-like peptidyl-prolyl isomerase